MQGSSPPVGGLCQPVSVIKPDFQRAAFFWGILREPGAAALWQWRHHCGLSEKLTSHSVERGSNWNRQCVYPLFIVSCISTLSKNTMQKVLGKKKTNLAFPASVCVLLQLPWRSGKQIFTALLH